MSTLKPLGPGFFPHIFAFIFSVITFIRNILYDIIPGLIKTTGRYTISVGGIHAGGTGKTPMALLLGSYFFKQSYAIAYLSRGYGRKSSQSIIVKPKEQQSWEYIGDEPAMLHQRLPDTWLGIGSNRFRNRCRSSP